jgi:protein KRI1
MAKDKQMMQQVKINESGASVYFKEPGTEHGIEQVDKEDENRENEIDVFEQKYNFRFEEANAATITSHARDAGVEESMRRPDETRKQARERAKDRKDDLKRKKKEELLQLKELKRQEILEKIKKADTLANGNLLEDKVMVEKIQKELETDFIPDLYDKTM